MEKILGGGKGGGGGGRAGLSLLAICNMFRENKLQY